MERQYHETRKWKPNLHNCGDSRVNRRRLTRKTALLRDVPPVARKLKMEALALAGPPNTSMC
ncbi:MAG: hypothetical protein J0I82_02655 [Spirosoma sp.]|uniref:hypothetical protein n=1 Tax=unclassified Spirosoma TaxID=2621999 RepID=UPI001AD32A52|nr:MULTISPECIES: hypothetical protein [unclassified Spirosoma]MBN8820897.1 hypothetical protein [Spirosoma sp.]